MLGVDPSLEPVAQPRRWKGDALRIAAGSKTHSGWAALGAIGCSGDNIQVIDRRRIERVEAGDAAWAKQPTLPQKDFRQKRPGGRFSVALKLPFGQAAGL